MIVRLLIRESRIIGMIWIAIGVSILGIGLSSGKISVEVVLWASGCALVGVVCWIGAIQRQVINDRENARVAQHEQEIFDAGYQAGIADRDKQALLTCPDCNHENQSGWLFCSSCGSKNIQ